MTREEEIKQVTDAYMGNYGADLFGACVQDVEQAFRDGIEWADEHPVDVWHEASEMPKDGEWILIQFVEDSYDTLVLCDMDADIYCAWCKMLGVIRWAYISDLLPKGGEE